MHGVKRGKTRRLHQTVTYRYFAIIFKIWALMCIKTTVPARMVRGLARTAAAIHGFSRMSRQQPVPAMATVHIIALAGKRKAKRSMQAVTITVTEAGRSIRPRSTSAQSIV